MTAAVAIIAVLAGGFSAQEPPLPPSEPQVLGRGTISLPDRHEFCSTMSADRREVFIGIEHGTWQEILAYRWDGQDWAGPEKVLGSPDTTAQDPYLSLSGSQLYFTTRANGHADLAVAQRSETGDWAAPVILGSRVNSQANEYYTSLSLKGVIVFSSDREEGSRGGYDLFQAGPDGGAAEPFPPPINTSAYEGDPFLDPEGRFLIFASSRDGGMGRGDLYLSVPDGRGGWSEPSALGHGINTAGHQLCPMVSNGGGAFLFTSDQDIYWVSADRVRELAKKARAQAPR